MVALRVGTLVEHKSIPGIGRVGEIDGDKVRVDCFESVVEPVAESWLVNAAECRRVVLHRETRVYRLNPDTGTWEAGRITNGGPSEYGVHFPNSKYDVLVPESQLWVRWDLPVRNPTAVLVGGANETGYFSNTRLPMLRSLIAQRAACASAHSFLSSGVEIFPHQIRAAMAVISDPVQRYLLADEVGMGKTIEAGLVIRQVLLDEPMSKVAVVAPAALQRQWRTELADKFFVNDFPFATIKYSDHETPGDWKNYRGFDLVVVDEAHLLVQVDDPNLSPYRELTGLAHSAERVLLLSATPLTSRVMTYLGLLHLLEPDLYKWSQRAAFEQKFKVRKELANAIYGLDAEYEALLPSSVAEIADLIPDDPQFARLSHNVLDFLTDDADLRDQGDRPALAVAVEALRAHISETYRLHRRMIRHRRVKVTQSGNDGISLPYELTGRAQPEAIALKSPRQRAVEDALLDWQSGVSQWLLDEGGEGDAAAYGQVLGILNSRADSASDDLADTLRWRVCADEGSAIRAGLTSEERALLSAPPVLAPERELLAGFDAQAQEGRLAELADALGAAITRHRRVVMFCGPGALATRLAKVLADNPLLRVWEHSRQAGLESGHAIVAAWRAEGGVLVADDSAEDGLNLQVADAVVHCRLPWSPNRLEQRIGRVDRHPGGVSVQPAKQFVLAGSDGEWTLPGAWLALLANGFKIFGESVSTLQDTIDQGLADLWATAVKDGPEGLTGLIPRVTESLQQERREIDSMDMLEEIHDVQTGAVDVAREIGMLESKWWDIASATKGLAGDEPGGLCFHLRETGPEGNVTQFELGKRLPLVPPRILARGDTFLKPDMMRGAFNRNVALREPGTRVLRQGNPFVDMLERTVWIDDRGQSTAFLRRDPHTNGEAYVYFGFDFLVEANIGEALAHVADNPATRHALRRQADSLLAPFTLRVWVHGQAAVTHQGQLKWLNTPYKPVDLHGPDINLNASRIGALYDFMGGQDKYAKAAVQAEAIAREELSRGADLQARCEDAQQQAAASLAVRRAQAEARKAAGRIVTDTEGFALDIATADALTAGLSDPTIKVISVTCLVRGMLPGLDRG